jgi:hypothetical protein
MLKTLGILVGGVFVGAVAVEVVRKKCPGAFDKLYKRTRKIAAEASEAFKNGYKNATRPEGAAEATA